jgi:hypothetical protein
MEAIPKSWAVRLDQRRATVAQSPSLLVPVALAAVTVVRLPWLLASAAAVLAVVSAVLLLSQVEQVPDLVELAARWRSRAVSVQAAARAAMPTSLVVWVVALALQVARPPLLVGWVRSEDMGVTLLSQAVRVATRKMAGMRSLSAGLRGLIPSSVAAILLLLAARLAMPSIRIPSPLATPRGPPVLAVYSASLLVSVPGLMRVVLSALPRV